MQSLRQGRIDPANPSTVDGFGSHLPFAPPPQRRGYQALVIENEHVVDITHIAVIVGFCLEGIGVLYLT